MAPSMKTPVGFPSASRMIWPLGGAFVFLSTLASRSARELAQPACPSTRLSQTGRPGAARSSKTAVGNSPPGQRLWSQFLPVIHEPGGVASARSFTRRLDLFERCHASQIELLASGRAQRLHVTVRIDQAREGEKIRPIDRLESAALGTQSTSAPVPTAAIAPSRTATASAQGLAGSPVHIRLTLMIDEACPSRCLRNARPGSLAVVFGPTRRSPPSIRAAAVHEQILQSRREPSRLLECCRIAKRSRIEHNDVGDRTRAKDASIGKPQDLGRKAGARTDRLLERDDLVVECVADLARKGPVGPRVGLLAGTGDVRRAVGGSGDEVVRITSRTSSSFMPKLIAEAPPWRSISSTISSGVVPSRLAIVARSSPAQSGPARVTSNPDRGTAVVVVEPLLDPGAELAAALGVRRDPHEVGRRSLECPIRHDHSTQTGARGDVGILVGGHRKTGRARCGDASRAPGRLSPSRLFRSP